VSAQRERSHPYLNVDAVDDVLAEAGEVALHVVKELFTGQAAVVGVCVDDAHGKELVDDDAAASGQDRVAEVDSPGVAKQLHVYWPPWLRLPLHLLTTPQLSLQQIYVVYSMSSSLGEGAPFFQKLVPNRSARKEGGEKLINWVAKLSMLLAMYRWFILKLKRLYVV
jgi:hypothetical protein